MIRPVSSRGCRARKALSSGRRASAVCTCRRQGSTRSTVATARIRPVPSLRFIMIAAALLIAE